MNIWVSIDYKEGTDFNPATFNTGGYWDISSGAQCMGAVRCLQISAASNFRRLFWYGNAWVTNPSSPYSYTALNVSEQWEDSIIWSTETFLFVPYVSYSYCRQLPPTWSSYCHDDVINGVINPPIQKQLTIALDPVLGGGVIITVPPGFPEYQCGINSEEECDFEVDYNAQVTFEAQANSGYAFSHWEINSQTMGDTDGEITIAMSGDKEVVAVFKRMLGWPLDGAPGSRTILSVFGADWLELCGGEVTKHTGIDIGATTTDVVYVAEDGIVKVASLSEDWGGWVTIEHNSSSNPYTTVYFHIIPSISHNDTVDKGDPIGTVVDYGGPIHLHFGLRNGAYNDTSNHGRLPQSICGGDPAFPENFENPSDFLFE